MSVKIPPWLIGVAVAGCVIALVVYLIWEYKLKKKKYRPSKDKDFTAKIVKDANGKIQDIFTDENHTSKKGNIYFDNQPFYKNEKVACFFIESPFNGAHGGKYSKKEIYENDNYKGRYGINYMHLLPYIQNNKNKEDNIRSKQIGDDDLKNYKKRVDNFFEQIKENPNIKAIQYVLGAHGSERQEISELQGEYIEYFLEKVKETKLPIYIKNLACFQATKTSQYNIGMDPETNGNNIIECVSFDPNHPDDILDGKDVKDIIKEFAKNYKNDDNQYINVYYAEHHSKSSSHVIKNACYSDENGNLIYYRKQLYNQYRDLTGGLDKLYTRENRHQIKNKIRQLLCKDSLKKTGLNI